MVNKSEPGALVHLTAAPPRTRPERRRARAVQPLQPRGAPGRLPASPLHAHRHICWNRLLQGRFQAPQYPVPTTVDDRHPPPLPRGPRMQQYIQSPCTQVADVAPTVLPSRIAGLCRAADCCWGAWRLHPPTLALLPSTQPRSMPWSQGPTADWFPPPPPTRRRHKPPTPYVPPCAGGLPLGAPSLGGPHALVGAPSPAGSAPLDSRHTDAPTQQ